jgi:hypothetical protein
MSRRFPRIRARLPVTVETLDGAVTFACHTSDVSRHGCYLDTSQVLAPGTPVILSLLSSHDGNLLTLQGTAARCVAPGPDQRSRGIGVRIDTPTPAWFALVNHHQNRGDPGAARSKVRLRVLVVGEPRRQRAALALYVTSGWDIRFATDLSSAEEALVDMDVNAIIAEADPADPPLQSRILEVAQKLQPGARRILRASLGGMAAPPRGRAADLVHWVVDADAGLDALVAALTADIETSF